jgi:hypothetical protein
MKNDADEIAYGERPASRSQRSDINTPATLSNVPIHRVYEMRGTLFYEINGKLFFVLMFCQN